MAELKNLRMVLSTNDENRTHLTGVPRAFESGAEGYFIGGKVEMDGYTFQVSCNAIRIGSKDEPEAEARREQVAEIKASKAARKAAAQ